MEPLPGRKAERPPGANGLLSAVGRAVGFCMLAGCGLFILAAAVLLPAYARRRGLEYRVGCLEANVADAEALVAARDRMIAAMPEDHVHTKRLAMNQGRLYPRNEVVVVDPGAPPSPPPGVVSGLARHPSPAPPSPRLLRIAAKLDEPRTRHGLFGLAAGALLAATFLFAPPRRPQRSGSNRRLQTDNSLRRP